MKIKLIHKTSKTSLIIVSIALFLIVLYGVYNLIKSFNYGSLIVILVSLIGAIALLRVSRKDTFEEILEVESYEILDEKEVNKYEDI